MRTSWGLGLGGLFGWVFGWGHLGPYGAEGGGRGVTDSAPPPPALIGGSKMMSYVLDFGAVLGRSWALGAPEASKSVQEASENSKRCVAAAPGFPIRGLGTRVSRGSRVPDPGLMRRVDLCGLWEP